MSSGLRFFSPFAFALLVLLPLCGPAIAQRPAQPVDPALRVDPQRDRFDFANQYFDAGQKSRIQLEKERYHQRSIELFTQFLADFPQGKFDAAARYRLGVSYTALGQPIEAKREFRILIRRHPKGELTGLAAYRVGSLEWAARDYRAAAPYFAIAAGTATGKVRMQALYFQGASHMQINQRGRAKSAYQAILDADTKIEPFTSRAHLQLGIIAQDEGKHEEAIRFLEPIFTPPAAAAERGPALLTAGRSYLELDRAADARTIFEAILRAADLKKYHPGAQASLMDTAYRAKEYDRVLSLYGQSTVEGKGKTPARLHLIAGKAANKLNRIRDAISYLSLAERSYPRSDLAFEAAFRRLHCFYGLEGANLPAQVDAFLEIYSRDHAAHSYIQSARLMKAETLFSLKRFIAAAEVYHTINTRLIDEKNRPGLLFHKGWCLAETGDPNGAIQAFSLFLADFPDHKDAVRALAKRGEAHLAAQDYDKALRDFDAVVTREGNHDDLRAIALQKAGIAARSKQDYPTMVQRYQQLLTDHPKLRDEARANAAYFIGWAQQKQKNYADAAEAFNTARQLDSKSFADLAGTQIVLCYYMLQEPAKLLAAVQKLEADVPGKKLPQRTITWLGIKCFERRDFENAALYLGRIVNHKEPGETKIYIWRQFAKASVASGNNETAITALNYIIRTEQNALSLADAYLDKGTALLALKRFAQAIEAVEEGQRKQPQGLINAELTLLRGDIAFVRQDYPLALKNYVTTAEFIADRRLKPIALHKAKVTAARAGDAKLESDYAAILQRDFPSFSPPANWPPAG